MSIGIVVDNTMGVVLTVTACVLVADFAVLTASRFQPAITTGAFMAITLAFAMVVNFLFLPPSLLTLDTEPPSSLEQRPQNAG